MSKKAALSTLLVLGLASAAYAQISGVVRCDDSLLPGVVIQVAGSALKSPKVVFSDNEGRYSFDAIPPGRFEITATLAGFGQQAVTVCVGAANQQIDFDLPLHTSHCVILTVPTDAAGNPMLWLPEPTTEEIAGTVIDGAGREVPTAIVQILANDRVLATTPVDSAGKFAVSVPKGVTALRILAAGFADRTIADYRDQTTSTFRIYRACP